MQVRLRESPVVSASGHTWRSLDLLQDDVNHVFGLLDPVRVFLGIIIALLVCLLLGCFWQWSFERLADECTLEHRVVALWVDRALLVM